MSWTVRRLRYPATTLRGHRRRAWDAEFEKMEDKSQLVVMEDSEFVDTRLYISVRPFLEYEIPEVSHIVYKAIIGDVTVDAAKQEVERLSNTKLCRVECVSPPRAIRDLNSHCMRVVNYAIEHVKQIEREWIDFLRRTTDGVRNETRAIHRDMEEVRQVYERYRSLHSRIAEREFTNEMMTLQRRLDTVVETYRGLNLPVVQRSDDLRTATNELRESFALAYGREHTSSLMSLRQYFESELATTQSHIVKSFCKRCREILA